MTEQERASPRVAVRAISVLFLIAGVVGFVGGWGGYWLDTRIERSGMRAEGYVTDKQLVYAADGDSDYIVSYRFELPHGEKIHGQHGVPAETWNSLRKGGAITVLYAADDPGRNFPLGAGMTSTAVLVWGSVLTAAIVALGVLLLIATRRTDHTDRVDPAERTDA